MLSQPLSGKVCPGKSQGQEGDQFVNAFAGGEMGILETETSGFQAAKPRFYLPAVGVVFEDRGGRIGADHNKKIAVFQLHPHHLHLTAPHATSRAQQPCFARLEIPKQGPGIDLYTVSIG